MERTTEQRALGLPADSAPPYRGPRLWARMLVFLGLVLCVNALIAFLGRGSYGHLLAIGAMVLFLGFPISVVMGLRLLWRRDEDGQILQWDINGFCVGMLMVSTVLSVEPGYAFYKRDLAAARAYCEDLVSRLEAYRDEHGAYPPDLVPLETGTCPIYFGKLRVEYTPQETGAAYEIELFNSVTLFDSWVYSSATGEWSELR